MNILFAGRLVDFKDPLTFIRAVCTLNQSTSRPDCQFAIAGDGELLEECRKLASGCGNILFLGWVKPEKVDVLMADADIFCQLSPFENLWASTLICAMKHRKAIICTDAGYTGSYLKHNYHVFLIPPRNHVALAEAIELLARNDDLRRSLGENAGNFAEENLSVERIAGQIRQLILELLQKHGQPRT